MAPRNRNSWVSKRKLRKQRQASQGLCFRLMCHPPKWEKATQIDSVQWRKGCLHGVFGHQTFFEVTFVNGGTHLKKLQGLCKGKPAPNIAYLKLFADVVGKTGPATVPRDDWLSIFDSVLPGDAKWESSTRNWEMHNSQCVTARIKVGNHSILWI